MTLIAKATAANNNNNNIDNIDNSKTEAAEEAAVKAGKHYLVHHTNIHVLIDGDSIWVNLKRIPAKKNTSESVRWIKLFSIMRYSI